MLQVTSPESCSYCLKCISFVHCFSIRPSFLCRRTWYSMMSIRCHMVANRTFQMVTVFVMASSISCVPSHVLTSSLWVTEHFGTLVGGRWSVGQEKGWPPVAAKSETKLPIPPFGNCQVALKAWSMSRSDPARLACALHWSWGTRLARSQRLAVTSVCYRTQNPLGSHQTDGIDIEYHH